MPPVLLIMALSITGVALPRPNMKGPCRNHVLSSELRWLEGGSKHTSLAPGSSHQTGSSLRFQMFTEPMKQTKQKDMPRTTHLLADGSAQASYIKWQAIYPFSVSRHKVRVPNIHGPMGPDAIGDLFSTPNSICAVPKTTPDLSFCRKWERFVGSTRLKRRTTQKRFRSL